MTDTGPSRPAPHQSFWLWVMCLTGVDYFSTLGYQPSIAFLNLGLLTPIATLILVAVTLFGALPVYAYVAGKSPHGQGSIAMLERLVHGWTGKVLVLILLGFAGTDFVITKTLSAADATAHLIENPIWSRLLERLDPPLWFVSRQQLLITMLLLVVLGAMFLRGFREVIGLAVVIVTVYMLMNAIIVLAGLHHLLIVHPESFPQWWQRVREGTAEAWHVDAHHLPFTGGSLGVILLTCLLLFPKLALGLSGFETGVAVMPLVRGRPDDDAQLPQGRIRNTRKLLLTAAVIMSLMLIGSSVVVTLLIPPEELKIQHFFDPDTGEETEVEGKAVDRALAYLAHGEAPEQISPLFGEVFGTMYDIATVVILWFAGASAMAGLLNIVPQYLPRYGMAPEWARATKPLVALFTIINLVVTWLFDANVNAQGAAYATGVLVLMSSAAVAVVIDRWNMRFGLPWFRRVPWGYGLIMLVFFYTTADIMLTKPDGLKIASFFIVAILISSFLSRVYRSTELRFIGFEFADENSRFLWESMKHLEFPVVVPHRPGHRKLAEKEEIIRREHRLTPDVPIVFLEAELGDPSEFYQRPIMQVTQEEGRFIIRVTRCASIPHVIAAVLLELSKAGKPPELHFGWSDESPLTANLNFVLFGEGNIPWLVRELIRKAEPNPERQPRIIIG
ncbi:MAG: amino acid transporter [Gemmatales bacterium]|nr:amino acid transporter [Gemmatales bacterium]MDW8385930.1 amino acid transporter [Gemmatales bacterium]